MARRDDAKEAALAASRTLNGDPQKVTDPAFAAGGFFDPADLLQVKYEMVRQVEVEGVPVSAAGGVRVRARTFYNARAALAAGGLAALIPGKPGPKGGTSSPGRCWITCRACMLWLTSHQMMVNSSTQSRSTTSRQLP